MNKRKWEERVKEEQRLNKEKAKQALGKMMNAVVPKPKKYVASGSFVAPQYISGVPLDYLEKYPVWAQQEFVEWVHDDGNWYVKTTIHDGTAVHTKMQPITGLTYWGDSWTAPAPDWPTWNWPVSVANKEHPSITAMKKLVPGLEDAKAVCPACFRLVTRLPLVTIVIHLNDSHRWTRGAIADWLDTLDVDLTVHPIEEEEQQHAEGTGQEVKQFIVVDCATKTVGYDAGLICTTKWGPVDIGSIAAATGGD